MDENITEFDIERTKNGQMTNGHPAIDGPKAKLNLMKHIVGKLRGEISNGKKINRTTSTSHQRLDSVEEDVFEDIDEPPTPRGCERDQRKSFEDQYLSERDLETPFSDYFDEDDEDLVLTRNDARNLKAYLMACHKMKLTPVNSFVRCVGKSEVVVKHDTLGRKGTKAIAIALINSSSCHSINLTSCHIGDKGAYYMAEVIQENVFVSSLTLSENNITSIGLEALIEVLVRNNIISHLDLSGNGFSEKDAKYFVELIEKNKTIRHLNISHNKLSVIGGQMLGKVIATNTILEELDLSWNHLRLLGAVAIANGIAKNSHIKRLNIAWNGFCFDGTTSIGEALETNTTLQELDISCNRIPLDGLNSLINGLKNNSTLKKLHIGQNPLTTDGAVMIANLMKNSPSVALTHIDLGKQSVDTRFVDIICEVEHTRKQTIHITHGVVLRQDDIQQEADDYLNDNPMMVLMEFMRIKNMRLVDLFTSLDADGSMSLTRDEFRDGLMSVNIPLSSKGLDKLLDDLDQDGDGEVDFAELMDGQKEHRRKIAKIQARQAKNPNAENELTLISCRIKQLIENKESKKKLEAKENAGQKSTFSDIVKVVMNKA